VAHRITAIPGPDTITTIANGTNHLFEIIDPLSPPHAEAAGGGRITTPIPGRIASVLVKPGDTVTRGQPLLVLEAMKMEMTLTAPQDGIIATLRCAVGDLVTEGVDLAIFQHDTAEDPPLSNIDP
jgi:3-methylcrotonyl-CoA carboxylase alpha subunit